MKDGFANIVQALVAEQGPEALFEEARCRGLLADYARGEFRQEQRLLLQVVGAGLPREMASTRGAGELEICKRLHFQRLHNAMALRKDVAAELVSLLASVLCGDSASAPAPGGSPQLPAQGGDAAAPPFYEDFAQTLNDRQMDAVESTAKHTLVLAGPGTGKTKTLIARAEHLVNAVGVDPRRICVLTFTRKAADEAKARLRKGNPAASHIFSGTFHNFCMAEMRSHPETFGEAKRSVIDMDDRTEVIRTALRSVDPKCKIPPKKVGEIISNAYRRDLPIRDYLAAYKHEYDLRGFGLSDEAVAGFVAHVADVYREIKRRHDYLDFDDIIGFFVQTLENDAEGLANIQGKYDHILVDEYQDIDRHQIKLLRLVAASAALFAVGDDAQSIYSFRGADFNLIHRFGDSFRDPATVRLVENYRSTQEILDCCNLVIKESPIPYGKQLVSAEDRHGAPPLVKNFKNFNEEAAWLAGDVKRRGEDRYPDIAILCRGRRDWSQVMFYLRGQNIPFRVYGGVAEIRPHVKDFLGVFKACLNPKDKLSWMRLKKIPLVGDEAEAFASEALDGLGTLEKAAYPGAGRERALADELAIRHNASGRLDFFLKLVKMVFQPGASTEDIVKKTHGFLKNVPEASAAFGLASPEVEGDIKALADFAKNFATLQDFVDGCLIEPAKNDGGSAGAGDKAVGIYTVHAAKGLEFPVVYALHTQDGAYPNFYERTAGQIEESRRMLYVALTRAKEELILTRSEKNDRGYAMRSGYGKDFCACL